MKLIIATIALAVTLCACSLFKGSTAANSLAASENTVSAAYSTYLALVVSGQIPTNHVPEISQSFNTFQALVTVTAAGLAAGTNAPATPDVLTMQTNVLNQIAQEKAK